MDRLSQYVIKHSSCSTPRCEYVENGIEIDCDRCQEIMIQEHDKQIRADAIDECKELLLSNTRTFYEDKVHWACPYEAVHLKENEIINLLAQLKEQK